VQAKRGTETGARLGGLDGRKAASLRAFGGLHGRRNRDETTTKTDEKRPCRAPGGGVMAAGRSLTRVERIERDAEAA
jgi:hypothetical protein